MISVTPMPAALAAGMFGAAALLAPSTAFAQVQAPQAVRNVVLVHGAWADGSSWNKVIPLLEAKGLHVVSVQHPLTSIADDVAATNRVIDAQDGPVLLVGHSYGGVVITEAGVNPKVAGLVYVAAFAPDAGETVGAISAPYGDTPAIGEIRPLKEGFLVLTPKGVAEDFAQDLPAAEQKLLAATQGPVRSAVLGTPLTAAAWRVKPSWAVIATNDRTIAPRQEIDGAKRMGAKTLTLTLASSHVAMLAKPKEVAAFIADAAAGK